MGQIFVFILSDLQRVRLLLKEKQMDYVAGILISKWNISGFSKKKCNWALLENIFIFYTVATLMLFYSNTPTTPVTFSGADWWLWPLTSSDVKEVPNHTSYLLISTTATYQCYVLPLFKEESFCLLLLMIITSLRMYHTVIKGVVVLFMKTVPTWRKRLFI